MRSIAIFCGSNFNGNLVVKQAIDELTKLMVQQKISLVFGGGKVGIMGLLADHILEKGGKAIGVIPQFLFDREVGHSGLTEMHRVDTMHQRKHLMNELSDGIIMLPGGIGTLEEFFEMFTWLQLGLIHKPIGILNLEGFFDHLLDQLGVMVHEQYLKPANLELVLVSNNPGELLKRMQDFKSIPI